METLQGNIRWFDGMSGLGMVRLTDGRSFQLHFTAINGIDKHNFQWPCKEDQDRLSKIDGLPCTLELLIDSTFTAPINVTIEGISK